MPGTVINTAQVQANEPDPNVGNDTDHEETNVVRRTDLAMDKLDDDSDAMAGMNYTYTLEVMNLGPSESSGATVTDTLPTGWAMVSSSNATCGGDANDPQTVTCTLGPLPIGMKATVTLTVAVPADAMPGTVTNWAQVLAHDPDPNADNNWDSEETTVVPGTGYVSGYVWNDLDGDGLWDAGEPGLNGWTVYVDLNDDGLLQADEPWFVTQTDGQHDGAFRFTNLPLGSHVVREWMPEAWRQTFPAGIDGAHRVASPIQGDFGQTAAPNFGNNLIQVIQFITPLSVLRPDAALGDHRFIRPADDPLTAWQGLNPALLLQDYLDAVAPWQSYPVQNASAATLRYTVTFQRHVQPPGDGFLVITDEQLNPVVGDTVTIDIPAGQTRRFFVFYDQPEMAPGDQVLHDVPRLVQPTGNGRKRNLDASAHVRPRRSSAGRDGDPRLAGDDPGRIERVRSPGRSLDFRQRPHLRWLRFHGGRAAIWPTRGIFADCARRCAVGSHLRYQRAICQRGGDNARNRLRRLRGAECRVQSCRRTRFSIWTAARRRSAWTTSRSTRPVTLRFLWLTRRRTSPTSASWRCSPSM